MSGFDHDFRLETEISNDMQPLFFVFSWCDYSEGVKIYVSVPVLSQFYNIFLCDEINKVRGLNDEVT